MLILGYVLTYNPVLSITLCTHFYEQWSEAFKDTGYVWGKNEQRYFMMLHVESTHENSHLKFNMLRKEFED